MEKANDVNEEKRGNARIRISSVVFISGLDAKGNIVGPDIGAIKNISKSGLMLELNSNIEYETLLLVGALLDGTQIEIKGKVIYMHKSAKHKKYIGIKFDENDSGNIAFVKEIVKNYHLKKLQS